MKSDPALEQYRRKSRSNLRAAKVEQIAIERQLEGYVNDFDQDGFDLLSRKDNHVIAYKVKVRGDQEPTLGELKELHARATAKGYDFRFVLTSLPHETRIRIEGLAEKLRRHLLAHPPQEIQGLKPPATVVAVGAIEIDELMIKAGQTEMSGSGMVDLRFGNGQHLPQYSEITDSVPFTFGLTLGSDLNIASVASIQVDTSVLDG